MARKILLYYCTAMALFLNISGLAASKQTPDYILQAVFLPITLFLAYSTIQSIVDLKKKKQPETLPAGKPIAALVIFNVLLVLGFVAKLTVPQSGELISPVAFLRDRPSITPTPTIAIPKTITITTENIKMLVNVRAEPASSSAILTKVKSGTVFPCLEVKEGWYQIKTKTGDLGWVFSEFAKTEEASK